MAKSFETGMKKWFNQGYRKSFSPYLFTTNPNKKCHLNPFGEHFDPTFFAVMMGQTEQEYANRYPISYQRYIEG
jgi:hypothetical protein